MQSWHYIIKFYKIGTHNLNTVLPTIWRWHFLGGPILRWKELAQMRVETIFMEFMEVMAKLERAYNCTPYYSQYKVINSY